MKLFSIQSIKLFFISFLVSSFFVSIQAEKTHYYYKALEELIEEDYESGKISAEEYELFLMLREQYNDAKKFYQTIPFYCRYDVYSKVIIISIILCLSFPYFIVAKYFGIKLDEQNSKTKLLNILFLLIPGIILAYFAIELYEKNLFQYVGEEFKQKILYYEYCTDKYNDENPDDDF